MRVRVSCLVGLAAIALAASCDQNPSAPTSHGTSGTGTSPTVNAPPSSSASSGATTAAIAGGSERPVTMQDACDPDTFNAAIGPGTCVRNGGVPFDKFLALLQQHGSAGAWHFSPTNTTARVGQTFVAINRGGETHTFTEVAAFGGGIVPALNQAIGLTTVAPECTKLESDDFVPAGGTYQEALTTSGSKKFQCCIHPWMHMEARVTDK
jgi:plastocyanin